MTGPAHLDLPRELIEILACPSCHAGMAIDHERGEIVCTDQACGLAYPVVDGIPVLLVDEARRS